MNNYKLIIFYNYDNNGRIEIQVTNNYLLVYNAYSYYIRYEIDLLKRIYSDDLKFSLLNYKNYSIYRSYQIKRLLDLRIKIGNNLITIEERYI